MYETTEEASFRLRSTLVSYKGEYCYVKQVTGFRGTIKVLLAPNLVNISLDDPDLVVRGIPTGYVNVGGRLAYVSRRPCRKYRQGLREDNCRVTIGFHRLLHWVMDGREEVPLPEDVVIINSDYCAKGDVLYYRERDIGSYIGGECYVYNHLSFLREAVKELVK